MSTQWQAPDLLDDRIERTTDAEERGRAASCGASSL
jgi:hypothetical protein